MVRVLSRKELENSIDIIEELKESVFIYPTDTIYGIGCNANDSESVKRIREIKRREQNPFSVIVPNKQFIFDNARISDELISWLDKLPGPYTLVCPLQNLCVTKSVIPETDALGIRMINSWFQQIVKLMNVPVVTTSVNLTGEPFMTSLDDLDDWIRNEVDFIIDDGVLSGTPSTLVLFTTSPAKIINR